MGRNEYSQLQGSGNEELGDNDEGEKDEGEKGGVVHNNMEQFEIEVKKDTRVCASLRSTVKSFWMNHKQNISWGLTVCGLLWYFTRTPSTSHALISTRERNVLTS